MQSQDLLYSAYCLFLSKLNQLKVNLLISLAAHNLYGIQPGSCSNNIVNYNVKKMSLLEYNSRIDTHNVVIYNGI